MHNPFVSRRCVAHQYPLAHNVARSVIHQDARFFPEQLTAVRVEQQHRWADKAANKPGIGLDTKRRHQQILSIGADRVQHHVAGKPDLKVQDQVEVPSAIQELKHYGMHRHFTAAGSVLMFGGGVKTGFLYGKTADERPCKSVTAPVTIDDLHATIDRTLGISSKLAYEIEQRPFYVTRDGLGKPVLDLLG